ncbi:TPA: LPXTG cell wall anchor domain-containing protein [Streptococcus suis]
MNAKKLIKWGVALTSALVLGGVIAPVDGNLVTTSAVVYAEDVTPYTVEYYLDGQLWGMVNYGYRRGWPYVKAVPDDLSFPNIDEIELVSSSIADPWRSTKEEIIATGGVLRYYWVRKGGVSQPVEKPVETPTEKPVGQPAEKPADQPVEIPAETPTEKPVETPIETPTEQPVEKPVEQPVEQPTEKPVEQPPVETLIEKPVETPAEQPAEQPVEIPAETPTDKPVEQLTDASSLTDQTAGKAQPVATTDKKKVDNSTPSTSHDTAKPTTKSLPKTGDSGSMLLVLGGVLSGLSGLGLAARSRKRD